jgi:predicted nuclease with TOPRIM domain
VSSWLLSLPLLTSVRTIQRLQTELQQLQEVLAEKSDWVSSLEMNSLISAKDGELEAKVTEIAKLKESSHNESTEINSLNGRITELESILSQKISEHQQ